MSNIINILRKQKLQKSVIDFNVLSVPNVQAWYDVSDSANTIVSGGNLVQLKDKSGNGRNLTTTHVAMPTYSATGGPNNLPFITIDAAHEAYLGGVNLGAAAVYMLFRLKDLTASTKKIILGWAGNTYAFVLDNYTSGAGYVPTMNVGSSSNSGFYKNAASTDWQVVAINGTDTTKVTGVRVNREPLGITCLAAFNTLVMSDIYLGYFTSGAAYELTELIVVNTSISQSDDNNIRNYLIGKGSVTANKPAVHIYGDSLSAGSCASWNYPYLISYELNMSLTNYGYGGTIVFPNASATGVAGHNFVDVYNEEFAYSAYNGQWGIFFYGVNDVGQSGINSAWLTGYQSFLQSLIDRGFDRNKMIIVTPPSTTTNAAGRATLNTYISTIASNLGIKHYDAFADFNANGGDTLFLDALHPNTAGNRLEADSLKAIITA